METGLDQIFLKFSVDKLSQLSERIEACLHCLNQDQVWMRSGQNDNAVGNIVLHLCGNIRQWIGSGIGGKEDIRVRDQEFAARGGLQPVELGERLRLGVQDAVETLRHVTPDRLRETVRIQGYDVNVLEAIYHVVEHFAQHTGQIIFATKLITDQDMGFYRHLAARAHAEKTP